MGSWQKVTEEVVGVTSEHEDTARVTFESEKTISDDKNEITITI